ncbi:MAG: hydrogenase [Planctomycetes bacterium]|nr:hydrogenase [Planctomycetota bacterium]
MNQWNQVLDAELVFVLLLNFFVLVTSRLPSAIYLVGLQGVLIGLSPLVVHQIANDAFDMRGALLSAGTVTLKGFVIPRMLIYALREVGIDRETHPIIGFVPQLLLGVAGTAGSLVLASTLPLRETDTHTTFLVVPAALSTVITGCLLMVTRRRAITQALGYLVFENGVFLFGLLLVEAMPFMVEVGVLLDLFVGIFVMGIIIGHISRGFASDSTQHLSSLKD